MTSLLALSICLGISAFLSVALLAAISAPLRGMIKELCPNSESMVFWLRFTLVMMFLSPLFTAVSFGLPTASRLPAMQIGEIVQSVVTASLLGSFFAMIAVGLWVSSLSKRVASRRAL